ncbi:MAG: type II 3-dehydroquinate dehydratase [Pseudomonadota bacterium]
MAIVMIQGPDAGTGGVSDDVHEALGARAQAAGQSLVHVRCNDARQLVERLGRIEREGADIILLDPGRCARDDSLHATLEHLPVPYIEVHPGRRDGAGASQPTAGPRLAVIDGYQAQSYTLAMSLALETLGCAESENDVHVGT